LQGGRAHDGCLLAVDGWRSLSWYQPARSEPADVQLGLAWLELKPTMALALAENKPKPLQHYIAFCALMVLPFPAVGGGKTLLKCSQ